MADIQELIKTVPDKPLWELEQEARDELQHWGVLGMKWGVRKGPDRVSITTEKKLAKLELGEAVVFDDGTVLRAMAYSPSGKGKVRAVMQNPSTKETYLSSYEIEESTIPGGIDAAHDRMRKILEKERAVRHESDPSPVHIPGKIEEFFEKTEELKHDELEHWGVLGMKWGVRKIRGTGKKQGKPVEGTKAAKRSEPSISPNGNAKKSGTPQSRTARKTASPGGETSVVLKNGKRVSVKLDQKQKSKMGTSRLKPEDLSIDQLRTAAERMRLEGEISKMLDGPNKEAAMQAVVNRIKLEAEYKRLTALPPTKRQQFMAKSKKMLGEVAETQIKAALNAVAANKMKQFLGSQGISMGKEPKKPDATPDPEKKKKK